MLAVKKIGTGLVWDFFKGICILGVQDTIDVFLFTHPVLWVFVNEAL